MWPFKRKQEPEYPEFEANDPYAGDYEPQYEPEYSPDYQDVEPPQRESLRERRRRQREERAYQRQMAQDEVAEPTVDEEEQQYRAQRRALRNSRILIVTLIYTAFLSLGYFATSFMTTPAGNREAQVVSVSLRETREDYAKFKWHYQRIGALLLEMDQVDQQFGQTGAFALSTQYQDVLAKLEQPIQVVKAMDVPSRYAPMKAQIMNLYTKDIAYYLQKMADGLTQDNATVIAEAMTWREKAISDYQQLRNNLSDFAIMVKLEDQFDLPQLSSPKRVTPAPSPAAPNQ